MAAEEAFAAVSGYIFLLILFALPVTAGAYIIKEIVLRRRKTKDHYEDN